MGFDNWENDFEKRMDEMSKRMDEKFTKYGLKMSSSATKAHKSAQKAIERKNRSRTISVNGSGNVVINGNKVTIDGKEMSDVAKGYDTLIFNGVIGNVKVDNANLLKIDSDVKGNVESRNGNIECGNVGGSVSNRNGAVTCGNVNGDVSTRNGNIKKTKPDFTPPPQAPTKKTFIPESYKETVEHRFLYGAVVLRVFLNNGEEVAEPIQRGHRFDWDNNFYTVMVENMKEEKQEKKDEIFYTVKD